MGGDMQSIPTKVEKVYPATFGVRDRPKRLVELANHRLTPAGVIMAMLRDVLKRIEGSDWRTAIAQDLKNREFVKANKQRDRSTRVLLLCALTFQALAVTQESAVDLAGTVWSKADRNGDTEYLWRFQPGGELVQQYLHLAPNSWGPTGKWRQADSAVYAEFNNKAYEFRGSVKGDTLSGTAGFMGTQALAFSRVFDPPELLTQDEYDWRAIRDKPEAAVDYYLYDYLEYLKFALDPVHRSEAVKRIEQWVNTELAQSKPWPQAGSEGRQDGSSYSKLLAAASQLRDRATINALAERALREDNASMRAQVAKVLDDDRLLAEIAVRHKSDIGHTDTTTELAASKVRDEQLLVKIIATNRASEFRSALVALNRLKDPGKLAELERSLTNVKESHTAFILQLVRFRRVFYGDILKQHSGASLEMVATAFPYRSYTYDLGSVYVDGLSIDVRLRQQGRDPFLRTLTTSFPYRIVDIKSVRWLAPPFDLSSIVHDVGQWLEDAR
jgi:hypothetical protein